MKEFDVASAARKGTAEQLSQILDLGGLDGGWGEKDLPAMLRHQFDAPLEFDLSSLELKGREARDRDETLTSTTNIQIQTFRDLLFHQQPPIEALKLAKEFFKWRTQSCGKESPVWKVAYLFYLLCLLAAGERAAQLTSLGSKDRFKGAKWALAQTWVDQPTKRLILNACKRLAA